MSSAAETGTYTAYFRSLVYPGRMAYVWEGAVAFLAYVALSLCCCCVSCRSRENVAVLLAPLPLVYVGCLVTALSFTSSSSTERFAAEIGSHWSSPGNPRNYDDGARRYNDLFLVRPLCWYASFSFRLR